MKLKRFLTLIFIISLIISFFNTNYVKAETNNNDFIIINDEIVIGNNIDITIDLNKIEYNKFIFKLKSNNNINSVVLTEEDINVDILNDSLSFEYDKENSTLSSLVLRYNLPSDIKVGDILKYEIEIINKENEEEYLYTSKEVKIIEDKKVQEEVKDNKIDNDNKQNNNENTNNKDNSQKESVKSNINSNQNKTIIESKSNNVDKKEQVTYKGSDNNFLKNITVSNYELNTIFTKDNLYYFITVEEDITKVDISVTKEDSNSIVKINGNDNLSKGLNKVLISVYSENGNVRVYKLYVKVGSE